MIKLSHRSLIILSGLIWFAIGFFLLTLGLHFLKIDLLNKGQEKIAMYFIVAALLVGYLKGKTVMTKAAKRQTARISSLNPPTFRKLYSPSYYLLILAMIGLGFLLRVLPISLAVRGAIDLAIGSALIQGSLHYFRFKKAL